MEKIKQLKKSVKLLSEHKFRPVDLKSENGADNFDDLSDNLKDFLVNKLDEQKLIHENISINYSLSNRQGDGFCFQGTITTKKAKFKIVHSGHYNHYNSKEIELVCLFKGEEKQAVYSYEFLEEDDKKADEEEKAFNDWYVDVCREMEKIGYEDIETIEEENIIKQGFEDWKEENDIISELELFDIDCKVVKYAFGEITEKPKGYIKICDSGDTVVELWIKDITILTKEYVKVVANIVEYTEHALGEN